MILEPIRTTDAVRAGTSRYSLRAAAVQHPYREVSAVGLDLTAIEDLCRAYLPVMEPGQAFSHTTALSLVGIPLPAAPPAVHVSVAFPRTPPRRPGVHGHALRDLPVHDLRGMPTSPPLAAWAQAAALLGREDLTAAADGLLLADRGRTPLATPRELDAVAASWHGRPGAARLRWAADHARPGARSRPETLLRLLLVRARLPEPVIEPPILVAGGRVLHPDLAFPAHRVALEYEGDVHRERSAWERDIERRELLADQGWRTVRVTSGQLFRHPRSLVERVRRHLAG